MSELKEELGDAITNSTSHIELSGPIDELSAALARVQGSVQQPGKNKQNKHLGYDYANLESVLESIKGPCSENDLAYAQFMSTDHNRIGITTLLTHSSGQWIKSTALFPFVTGRNQWIETGTASTYLRRYTLSGIFGIFQSDDDTDLEETSSNNLISKEQLRELENLTAGMTEDNKKRWLEFASTATDSYLPLKGWDEIPASYFEILKKSIEEVKKNK